MLVSVVAGALVGVLVGFQMVLGLFQRRLSVLHSSRLLSSDARDITSVVERIKVLIGFGQPVRPGSFMVALIPVLATAVIGIFTILISDPSSTNWDLWFLSAIVWTSTFLTGTLAGFSAGDMAAKTTMHDILLESVLPTEYAGGVVEGALENLGRVNIFRELLRMSSPRFVKGFQGNSALQAMNREQ